jgi:hypothetical protein
LGNTGIRRVLTALLSPPFNLKLMSINVSACGFGFIFALHIQRLLRLAAVDLSDNNFMLPPSKTVAEGLLAVQKYLQDPPVAASRALESCLAQQLSDVAISAATAVIDLTAWQTATTSCVTSGCGFMWCTLLKSRHLPCHKRAFSIPMCCLLTQSPRAATPLTPSKYQRDRFQAIIENALVTLKKFVPLLSRCPTPSLHLAPLIDYTAFKT